MKKQPFISAVAACVQLIQSAVDVAAPVVKSAVKELQLIRNKKRPIIIDSVSADIEAKLKSFESEAVHSSIRSLQLAVVQFNRTQLKILEKIETLTEQVVHGSSATEELTHEVNELLNLVKDSIEVSTDELDDLESGKNLFNFQDADRGYDSDVDDAAVDDEDGTNTEQNSESSLTSETADELDDVDVDMEADSTAVDKAKNSESNTSSEEKRKKFLRKLN